MHQNWFSDKNKYKTIPLGSDLKHSTQASETLSPSMPGKITQMYVNIFSVEPGYEWGGWKL